ncbi:DUF805 domain-containing protein [Sphingomonas sp. G-3-2-10]|uniref:DUF805 domain-containing protein n=1 Tax=Sphingomonas sp. G-3-2-10 TaxID=2728838 RepID=UPI00146D8470|nr:DUF805 domain-containing protein [Sphingomonas sp. G-3-2-10]
MIRKQLTLSWQSRLSEHAWYRLYGLASLLDPRGRETRRDFALILAWCILFPLAVAEAVRMVLGSGPYRLDEAGVVGGAAIGWTMTALALLCAAILLMTLVRRLNDQGGGWATLLWLMLPYIGWCMLLIAVVAEGDAGENRHGPDPRGPNRQI